MQQCLKWVQTVRIWHTVTSLILQTSKENVIYMYTVYYKVTQCLETLNRHLQIMSAQTPCEHKNLILLGI